MSLSIAWRGTGIYADLASVYSQQRPYAKMSRVKLRRDSDRALPVKT